MFERYRIGGTAFVTSGIGFGRAELSAFDAAELDANILAANAIKASSFVPPGWRIVNDKEGLAAFTDHGAFLPMAYAYAASNTRHVAASVAIGINADATRASIIMEHADVDVTARQSLAHSAGCVEEAFGARRWVTDRLEEVAVEGAPRDGLYVCVLVAVVFVTDQSRDRPVAAAPL